MTELTEEKPPVIEAWRVELVHRDGAVEVQPMRGQRPDVFPPVVMFGPDLFRLADRRLTPPSESRSWIVRYEVVDVFSVDLQRVVVVHDEDTLRAAQFDAHEATALLVAQKLAETAGLCQACGAHSCACEFASGVSSFGREVLVAPGSPSRCCEGCTHVAASVPRSPSVVCPACGPAHVEATCEYSRLLKEEAATKDGG